jgi:hypothetical protein
MGLIRIHARFPDSPPSEDAFRRELVLEVGDDVGLESFQVDGNLVQVQTMLDPVTEPYAVKVLQRLGGVMVDSQTHEPKVRALPGFVSRPWRDWPMWKRAVIHVGFQLALVTGAVAQRIL